MFTILTLMKSMLRPKDGPAPGAVAMLGIKGGDAVLFLGADRPDLAAAAGVITGLNGQTTVAARAEGAAGRIAHAAAAAGALVDFVDAPPGMLPMDPQTFDVAILPVGLAALGPAAPSVLAEAIRIVRPGGRIVLCEPLPRQGLFRLAQKAPEVDPQAVVARMTAAGLRAARHLGNLHDTAFFEAARAR